MKRVLAGLAFALAAGAILYGAGFVPEGLSGAVKAAVHRDPGISEEEPLPEAPLVTVAAAEPAEFAETVLATGTLVPREEILVAPEVDGLRVLEVKAEAGDRVKKGDVLATLVQDTLDAQLAQNDAAIARADAAIARAKSQIAEAEARAAEARAAFERTKPLRQSGHVSQSVYDGKQAAARATEALLAAARDGLAAALAEKKQAEAQRRETVFRLGRTGITAPEDGLVSRRTARIGAMASLSGEPLFRIVAKGEVELEAEVTEADLAKIAAGDPARVSVAGLAEPFAGTVRLVSPEVDRATRLGHVRIFLGSNPSLRIGSFGRGEIETRRSRGLAVPASAVMYGPEGAYVAVAEDGRVRRRNVTLGLHMGELIEVRHGLSQGEPVVAKAGTFLRDGDPVRAALPQSGQITEVHPAEARRTEAHP